MDNEERNNMAARITIGIVLTALDRVVKCSVIDEKEFNRITARLRVWHLDLVEYELAQEERRG